MLSVGIDAGGTFTDFVFFDGEELSVNKVPSTPRDPSIAVLKGLKSHPIEFSNISEITHGPKHLSLIHISEPTRPY